MLIKSVDHERYMTHVIDFMLKVERQGPHKLTKGGD